MELVRGGASDEVGDEDNEDYSQTLERYRRLI